MVFFPVHFILHSVCFGFKEGLMKQKALKAAFPYTLPIFAGFWFLALAYGILMNVNGFSFVYPMFEPASLRDGRPAGSFLILFQFFFGSDSSSLSKLS